MQIQLTWEAPINQQQQQLVLELPVALGREKIAMPSTLDGQQVSHAIFSSDRISRYHTLIALKNGQLSVEDKSTNGTIVNGKVLNKASQPLSSGDVLEIGPYIITITTEGSTPTVLNNGGSTIIFNPETDAIELEVPVPTIPPQNKFPPAALFAAKLVSVQAIHATGLIVEEKDYAALGGGLGSFTWVDTIRIYGVKPEKIVVLGLQNKPYGRYQDICRNSQIPGYERLRSGSDSCPDNIWGWPGYAWRESWREIFSGQISSATKHLWQVFAEPALADTYTPQSSKVFQSIDREAERIGWNEMFRPASIRGIRKTEDGRYVIAYSVPKPQGQSDHRFLIAKYVHLATGYPAIKLLPDLQQYRAKYQDFQSVVNAYENHQHIYDHLERKGGTVVVRGQGIVASRIMQKLYETRQKNRNIVVVHLLRTQKTEGNKFGYAQRYRENNWEFQPYNWPKATWGGDMRKMIENASPAERYRLLEALGGTTTADRQDWRQIIKEGLKELWYTITFGEVEKVERNAQGQPITYIKPSNYTASVEVKADFIIDATGLDSDPQVHPLLKDLITHYDLPLNVQKKLDVAKDFELVEMRNDRSRMYAAGIITLGGPYAAVDTFLGLQYCAQRATYGLINSRAPGIKPLWGLSSLWQWIKWATNQAP